MKNSVLIIPLSEKEIKECCINYFFYETHYGLAIITSTQQGICFLGFGEKEEMFNDLTKRFQGATLQQEKSDFHKTALNAIETQQTATLLPLHLKGTSFQLSVWKALLQIPLGKTSTYKQIAQQITNPKAIRAVGTAIGQNPISYFIPCHRVIRTDGNLGGYHWGIELKKQLLNKERETCQSENS